MKLNVDIIYDNLRMMSSWNVEVHGEKSQELCLNRPEFYTEDTAVFLRDHVYVMKAEQLIQHKRVEKGALLICAGESMYLPYYYERCSVMVIRERMDCFRVFNLLTKIYDKYDRWSDCLHEILNSTAVLGDMIACSREIFENPMFVLNANFHYLVHSDYSGTELVEWEKKYWGGRDSTELPLDALNQFMELHEMATHVKKPMLINLLDSSTLNVNLFENGEYAGCLTIDYQKRMHRGSDEALAAYLAKMLELALKKYSSAVSTEKNALKQALIDILEGYQVSLSQRRVIDTSSLEQHHICIQIQFNSALVQIPMKYFCTMLEKEFRRSVAFEYNNAIVEFIEITAEQGADGSYHDLLKKKLMPIIQAMDVVVGVSDPFEDIYNARMYYLQTGAALENGKLFSPEACYYPFQNYALTELVINAIGNLPMGMYYSEGLRRLEKHDEASSVSYVETLRTYLDRNMSVTKTTADLYINRSTLLERISRIKRELNCDLQDPDERLRLQILLKAQRLYDKIQKKNGPKK